MSLENFDDKTRLGDVGGGLFNMGLHMSFWTQLDNWTQAAMVGGKTNVVLPFSSLPSKLIPAKALQSNKHIIGTDGFGLSYFAKAEEASGQNIRTIVDYVKHKKIRGGGNFRDSGLGFNINLNFLSKKGMAAWTEKLLGRNALSKTVQLGGGLLRGISGITSIWASMPFFYATLAFQVTNGVANYLEGEKISEAGLFGSNKKNTEFSRNANSSFNNTAYASKKRSMEIENILTNNINLQDKF